MPRVLRATSSLFAEVLRELVERKMYLEDTDRMVTLGDLRTAIKVQMALGLPDNDAQVIKVLAELAYPYHDVESIQTIRDSIVAGDKDLDTRFKALIKLNEQVSA